MKPKSQVSVVGSKTKAQKVPLRWSGHLPLAIRIALSGSDENGRAFSESTQTVGVDRRGARIVTSHPIALGAEVTVENSAMRRTAKAKVVWRGDGGSAQKSEVVVELLDPTESVSIWGIKFPSQNNKTAPTAPLSTRVSEPPVSGEQTATTQPGSSSDSPDLSTESLVQTGDLAAELEGLVPPLREETERSPDTLAPEAASETLAALQDHTETLRRSADEAVNSVCLAAEKAVAELRAVRQETEANVEAGVEEYDRRLAELSASGIESFERKIQTAVDELQQTGATGLAQSLQEIAEHARQTFADQLRQQAQGMLSELSGSGIESFQCQSESLSEDFQRRMQTALDELQQKGATGLAQSLQEIVEHARQGFADQLQQQAQSIWTSLSGELKTSVAPLVDEAGSRIADATRLSIERVAQGAQAAIEECRIQTGREFQEQAVAVSRSAESGAKSVQVASDEALAKLEAARVQIETGFCASADSFRQRLGELSASEIEALQRQSDAILQGFETQLLQKTLQDFQEKVAQEVADQIPNITQDLLERSARGLQKQADDTVERLSEELKASRVALVDETRQQIAALTQTSVESLRSQGQAIDEEARQKLAQTASQCAQAALESVKLATEEAAAGLQAAQGKMQGSTEALAEEYQKRLAELTASGVQELGRGAGLLLENFQDQLRSTLDDFQQKSTKDLTGQLQGLAERLQRSCTEQLQRHADDALKASNEELRTSRMALIDDTREQIAAFAQTSLESLGKRVRTTEDESWAKLHQTASKCADAALDSIKLAKEEAVTSLHEVQAGLQASTAADVEEYQKRLAELSASGVEEMGRKTGGLIESFQDQLRITLNDFQQRSTADLTAQLQEIAERLQRVTAEQLQRHADDALTASKEELQASSKALLSTAHQEIAAEIRASLESLHGRVQAAGEECRARLDQTASQCVQTTLGSINLAAEEGVAGLQAEQAKVRAALDHQSEECEKRLAKASSSVIQEFGLMAGVRLETFKGELQNTLDDFHDQGTTQLTDRLQKSAEGLQQRCTEALRKQSDDTLKSLSDELETSGTRLVYEARLRLADTARASMESLNQELQATSEQWRSELAQTASQRAREAADSINLAGDQAVARLEAAQEATKASFTADAERERKALADLSASSMEELRRTADSVLFGFSHSLKQKAGVTSEEAGHQLRGMLEELATSSLRDSQAKHEELVKKQRKVFQDNVDLAAQATLDRFARKLAGLEQEHERGSMTAKLAWVLVAVAPTILFIYLATRPVMQLRVDPPAEFLSAVNEAGSEHRAAEERAARAYWDWAYLHLQHKYPFAAQLPEDPPLEMEVYGNDLQFAKTSKREEHSDPADLAGEVTKRRYWQKLRQVWAMPQAWEKSSLWDRK